MDLGLSVVYSGIRTPSCSHAPEKHPISARSHRIFERGESRIVRVRVGIDRGISNGADLAEGDLPIPDPVLAGERSGEDGVLASVAEATGAIFVV